MGLSWLFLLRAEARLSLCSVGYCDALITCCYAFFVRSFERQFWVVYSHGGASTLRINTKNYLYFSRPRAPFIDADQPARPLQHRLGTSLVAVIASLALFALSASCAIFLILELSEPFTGLMMISDIALRRALPLCLANKVPSSAQWTALDTGSGATASVSQRS